MEPFILNWNIEHWWNFVCCFVLAIYCIKPLFVVSITLRPLLLFVLSITLRSRMWTNDILETFSVIEEGKIHCWYPSQEIKGKNMQRVHLHCSSLLLANHTNIMTHWVRLNEAILLHDFLCGISGIIISYFWWFLRKGREMYLQLYFLMKFN